MSAVVERLTTALASRYRIEREVGAGGMATVYLAQDLRHDRKVALKVLRPELGAILGVERFLSEIRVTANLQHPHLLPLFDSGEAEGLVYYVMPFVEGESLRDRLVRERQLGVGEAVRIATQVAGALHYAHRHGVIHRDIKPENILLHDGQALVADFGIARAVRSAGGARLTETGLSLGTPQYMSPEQATGDREIDARSDVYSLAAVLYEMLAGEPPHTGPTVQAVIAKVVTDRPRPLPELRDTVPIHVAAAVHRALAKLPADRYSSAADFVGALERPDPAAWQAIPWATARVTASGPIARIRRALPWVIAALAVGAAAWALTRAPAPAASPVARLIVSVPVSFQAEAQRLAVSPDGATIVFNGTEIGTLDNRLYLRPLDRLGATPIPGTENADAPFFSPDGRRIGFFAHGYLRIIALDGSGTPSPIEVGQGLVLGATWGDDDVIVFSQDGRLRRIQSSGGPVTSIPQADTSAALRWPVWLPGTQTLLAEITSPTAGLDRAIVAISSETGEIRGPIAAGTHPTVVLGRYLTFLTPEGNLVAAPFDASSLRLTGSPRQVAETPISIGLAVSLGGTVVYGVNWGRDQELVLVGPHTTARSLPAGNLSFQAPRFSPDGRRIAMGDQTSAESTGDVWIFDQDRSTLTRLTSEGGSAFPTWADGGGSVVYSTGVGGAVSSRYLLRVPADGSGPPDTLLGPLPGLLEGELTPDGGTLVYRMMTPQTARDILVLPPGGAPRPFAAGRFQERSLAISPDGRWVAYVSDESGADQVYVRPLIGGGRWQVSSARGTEPRWARTGREIFYRSADTLFAVGVDAGSAIRLGTRRVALVGRYVADPYHANYDVAPDGRTFVMIREPGDQLPGNLLVVLNWFDHFGDTRP